VSRDALIQQEPLMSEGVADARRSESTLCKSCGTEDARGMPVRGMPWRGMTGSADLYLCTAISHLKKPNTIEFEETMLLYQYFYSTNFATAFVPQK
jgi:hypothetical protein